MKKDGENILRINIVVGDEKDGEESYTYRLCHSFTKKKVSLSKNREFLSL